MMDYILSLKNSRDLPKKKSNLYKSDCALPQHIMQELGTYKIPLLTSLNKFIGKLEIIYHLWMFQKITKQHLHCAKIISIGLSAFVIPDP